MDGTELDYDGGQLNLVHGLQQDEKNIKVFRDGLK